MQPPMNNDFAVTRIADREVSSRHGIFLVALACVAPLFYLTTIWSYTSNIPSDDDYIVSLFSIVRFVHADTWHEKLSAITWTYMQHRGIYGKIIYVIDYFLTGKQNFHLQVMLGNLSLCVILFLLSRSIVQYKMPLYGIPLSSFLIFSFYAWTVSVWPGGSIWYFGTIMWALACFYAIDAEKPQILIACFCSWLATYTFANGILSIPVASLLLLYNQYQSHHQNAPGKKRYSNAQLILWFGSGLVCLAVYFSTINLFSTDLYGAKTLEQSFINVPGRLLDFVESVGAVTFPTGGDRTGKILFGTLILVAILLLLISRKFLTSPAIVAFWAFNFGTLFVTSLFRYSAGGNPGYQIFSCINLATLLIMASGAVKFKSGSPVPALLLLLAIAFNLQGMNLNLEKMQDNHREADSWLANAIAAHDFSPNEWKGGIVIDAIDEGIYTPDFIKNLPTSNLDRTERADLYKRTCNGLKKQFFVKAAGPLFDTYCKKQALINKNPSA
jgi:hypothetical protein